MKRRNQNRDSTKRGDAAALNLLDLSEPKPARNGGLYWTMLVSMIAAYGSYMATIANLERSPGFIAENMQSAEMSLAAGRETEALEKADREPIEINIPKPPEAVAEDTPEPAPKIPERLPRQENDGAAPDEPPKQAVRSEPPAPEEPAIVVHAMTSSQKVSPAARAILRRINEAAHAGNNLPSIPNDAAENAKPVQLAAQTIPPPPLPERRPYIAREIASQQLSSQSGSRLSRPEHRPAISSGVLSYRQSVRAHLAVNRPSGGFGSGRVSLAFRLSAEGWVSSAQVIQAPDSEDLDERALAALYNAAPFPAAPDDAAAKYRAFTVSFIFE